MAEDLETVLRLVAEGHLTPEEASPIIEALTRAEVQEDDPSSSFADADIRGLDRLGRIGRRMDRRIGRGLARAQARAEAAQRRADEAAHQVTGMAAAAGGRRLRITVTERGRQVVNLRIPIGFVETALAFVPGLGGDQASRIRQAVQAGATGPILDVEDPDGEGGVLISVE